MSEVFEEGIFSGTQEFIPDTATEIAWEARSHLLRLQQSEVDSVQAEQAKEFANKAFGDVVTLTEPRLFASAMQRTGGDSEAVAEILQETYIRSYRGLTKFRGDCQIETWLHSIMFRQLSTYYKKQSKRIGNLALGHIEVSEEGDSISVFELASQTQSADLGLDEPETYLEREEIRESIMNEIEHLSPKLGEVVKLHYFYGLTHDKVAEKLGISVSASKVRLHRAINKLRSSERLKSLFGKEPADNISEGSS